MAIRTHGLLVVAMSLVLGLSACGDGGGGPKNVAPVAGAGSDQTVLEGATVTLSGARSSDEDGRIVSYAWAQVSGPLTVVLSGAGTVRATFQAPEVSADATFEFELTVVDNNDASATDRVTVTVRNNLPPVARAGSDQTVLERTIVTLSGAGSSDEDGRIVSYAWAQVSGPSTGLLSGASTVRAIFQAPEVSADTAFEFELTVVDNNGASATDRVTVTVRNNLPPVARAGSDQTVLEGTTVTLSGAESSDEDGRIASYAWVQVSGPSTVFLSGVNTVRTTFQAPEVSSDATFEFRLHVVDNHGASDTDEVTVTVRNEAPRRVEGFVPPTEERETIEVDGTSIFAAADQVLVFLKDDVTPSEVDAIRARADEVGIQSGYDSDLRTLQIVVDSGVSEEAIIRQFEALPGTIGAGPNAVVAPERPPTLDNEEGYRNYLEEVGVYDLKPKIVPPPTEVDFPGDYWIDTIDAVPAWEALSAETLFRNSIAVADQGLPARQDLLASGRVRRFNSIGNPISDDDTPDLSHGIWVSGFAVGYNNSPTRRGVNPHSDLVIVDIPTTTCRNGRPGCAQTTDILNSVKTAVVRSDVVNVSWGDATPCDASQVDRLSGALRFRKDMTGAMNFARRRDKLVVWSSMNNCEKQDDQLLPSSVPRAAADSWLSHALIVGASDSTNRDACFSRMGGVVNLAAPGRSVGWGARTNNGTSFAAPLVAGAAGLVHAINDTLSAPENRAVLLGSAANLLTPRTTAEARVHCPVNWQVSSTETVWAADEPLKILNLNSAVQTGLLTKDIPLDELGLHTLRLGERRTVRVPVTIPASGVNALDIVFLIDQSGSYGDDIDSLQAQATNIVNDLSRRGIDVQFAVAGFADFPIGSYGSSRDVAYRLYQPLTGDLDAVLRAIQGLDQPLMSGSDGPESQLEALFQVATGRGRDVNGDGDFDDPADVPSRRVGWREGAFPVVMFATDATFHDSALEPAYPGASKAEAIRALQNQDVVVFGLQSGFGSSAGAAINEIAEATGGLTFELDAASSEIARRVLQAVNTALESLEVELDVIAGNEWVSLVEPATQAGSPGETITFAVTLRGVRNQTVDNLPYEVYFWARADGKALLKRARLSLCPSAGGCIRGR